MHEEGHDGDSHEHNKWTPVITVLAIDAVLIGLYLTVKLGGHRFVAAKALGTTALIGTHFFL